MAANTAPGEWAYTHLSASVVNLIAGASAASANVAFLQGALSAAKALNAATVYFKVVPDADCYMRVGSSSVTASATDQKIVANFGGGAIVPPNGGLYVYLYA